MFLPGHSNSGKHVIKVESLQLWNTCFPELVIKPYTIRENLPTAHQRNHTTCTECSSAGTLPGSSGGRFYLMRETLLPLSSFEKYLLAGVPWAFTLRAELSGLCSSGSAQLSRLAITETVTDH